MHLFFLLVDSPRRLGWTPWSIFSEQNPVFLVNFQRAATAWVKATGRVDALTEGPAPNVVRYSLPIEIMHALDMMEPRIDAAPDDGIEPIDIEELRRLAGDDRVP